MSLLGLDFVFGLVFFSIGLWLLQLVKVPIEIAGVISGVVATLLFVVLVATQSAWEGDDERSD
jgi:hypothetical protein